MGLHDLAQSIKAALFSSPEREEWKCQTCNLTNWMDRTKCRSCHEHRRVCASKPNLEVRPTGKGKGHGKHGQAARLPPGSVWAPPNKGRAAAAALEQVARDAKKAGATQTSIHALFAEAKEHRQKAAGELTVGARWDLAIADRKRAERSLASARKRLTNMQRLVTAAEQRSQAADEAVKALEKLVADAKEDEEEEEDDNISDIDTTLLTSNAQHLKQSLEVFSRRRKDNLPPAVMDALVVVHSFVDNPEIDAAEGNDDDTMDLELIDEDEADKDALVAAIKRFKRARVHA